jgi:S1-C subfamily serine protease
VVAALVAGGVVMATDDDDPVAAPVAQQVLQRPSPPFNGEGMDIHEVLAAVDPSVVAIEIGQEQPGGVFGTGAGTGIILSADGLVLTNNHVVENADRINVRTEDGEEYRADLVDRSPAADVALVQLRNAQGLTPATLGSSDALRVGDEVLAIGNALGLEGTPSVTRGIVSAVERSIDAQGESLDNLIQTDAAINPGNSGGPLVNGAGEVVGMNTAIIAQSQNIGFAIAIDSIKPLIENLRDGIGFLGVSTTAMADLDEATKQEFGVEGDEGLLVAEVSSGTAAEEAGLRTGDVVLSIDGQAVNASGDLGELIGAKNPGDQITLEYRRGDETRTVDVTLGSRADLEG